MQTFVGTPTSLNLMLSPSFLRTRHEGPLSGKRAKLCKVHYLRKAAFGAECGGRPFSAFPASDALHAALRTNVVEGLGAAIRRVSHEQQLWAVQFGELTAVRR